MNATEKNQDLARRVFDRTGAGLTESDAATLRRAELALRRWAERECGDGSRWHVERDETTGEPWEHYNGDCATIAPKPRRVPDLEAGALRRVAAVCKAHGLHYYHQTDPRGAMLYVSAEPMTDQDYHRGVCCGY
jgi:hypothetical protein